MADNLLNSFLPDDRAATGFFPQMKPRRRFQDREASANVPLDVTRGRFAGMAGFLPDALNFMGRSPMPTEMFGDTQYEPTQQLPYGSEYYLENLPLKPTSRIGEVAGQAGAFVPLNPMPAARAVAAGAMAAGRAGERFAERAVPRVMERGGMGAEMLQGMSRGTVSPMGELAPISRRPTQVDPNVLVFREKVQNRKADLKVDTDEFDPIVVIDNSGKLSILDGHNRAAVAKDRGDSLAAVKIKQAEYDALQAQGFEDGEIAWAALQRADQSGSAGNLVSQFPGADIARGGDKAWDALIDIEGKSLTYPQQAALDLAQQRAALPIEQSGLGLPANKPQSALTDNEILEQFWKDLDKAGDGYIGVRADDAIVKNSFRKSWNRPDQVKTTRLPGTSVMGVGQDNITKEKLLEAIKNVRGYGKNVYLLEGKSPTDMQYLANDPGERLLSDNKILSSFFNESAEMRGGVKKGQPLFTAAPIGGIGLGAGTQDNEMPDAVRQYMADPRYSDPFADTTR